MPLDMVSPHLANDGKKGVPLSGIGQRSDGKATYLQTRILIIEDEMMIAWMLESLLSDAGFVDIAVAADGDEARRMAAELPPGLVVSDINLGAGMTGVEASVAICGPRGIPVLFVTAYADEATRDRITTHFPRAELLRKPVNSTMLIDAVMRALNTEPRN